MDLLDLRGRKCVVHVFPTSGSICFVRRKWWEFWWRMAWFNLYDKQYMIYDSCFLPQKLWNNTSWLKLILKKILTLKKKTPNGGFIDGCSHQVIGPGISQCPANHDTIKMMEFVEMMDMLWYLSPMMLIYLTTILIKKDRQSETETLLDFLCSSNQFQTPVLFWLVVEPSLWKMMEWKSVGMMTFPIYGKS